MFKAGDVVKFVEKHKWCGCLGFVKERKQYSDGRVRLMVGVPVPQQGVAYIFTMEDEKEVEYVGLAVLVPGTEDDEEADHE